MRFYYLHHSGGAEVQAFLIGKKLSERGWNVHYIAEQKNDTVKIYDNRENFHFHWIPYQKKFEWLNGIMLYKLLCQIKPDFVLQRYSSFYTGVLGFFAKAKNIPFVWICTDYVCSQKYSRIRYALYNFTIRKYSFLKKIFVLSQAFINDISIIIGLKFAKMGFALSQKELYNITNNYKIPKIEILRVGHELPTSKTTYLKHTPIILWVGNLGIGKNPEDFIRLAELCKDNEYKFWMIGDHYREDRKQYLRSLIKNLPNLELFTAINFDGIHFYYNKANIFINTTKIPGGGIGNTNAQALIRGIPIISLYIDPDNIIKNNQVGFLSQNIHNAKMDIEHLLNNEAIYQQISTRCYQFAKQNLNIEKIVDQIEKCLIELSFQNK